MIPRHEFPKEIWNWEDIEPFVDINKDSSNNILDRSRSVVTPPPSVTNPLIEDSTDTVSIDGNVDYCFECKRGGDVVMNVLVLITPGAFLRI